MAVKLNPLNMLTRQKIEMSAVSTREMEVYAKDYFRPIVEEVARIMRDEDAYYVVTDYLVANHGLE